MSTRRSRSVLFLGAIVFHLASVAPGAAAEAPTDPAAAREQLKQGFALRRAGKFAEALPHLAESFRLAPQVKALLNIADCEEHLGRFVDAEQHWLQARDLADKETNVAMRREAATRLDELEQRMPRLIITVSPGGGPAEVRRDGVLLEAPSLGVPLPCDPGNHVIEISAEGHESALVQVVVGERESKSVAVAPGAAVAKAQSETKLAVLPPSQEASSAPPQPGGSSPSPDVGVTSARERERGETMPSILPYIAVGAATLAASTLAFALFEGLDAQHEHSVAAAACDGGVCGPTARAVQSDASTAANWSTAGYVAGGVLAAAAVALILFRGGAAVPRSQAVAGPLRVRLSPVRGRSAAGSSLELAF